uniref:STIL centriolar assembly protein n=1 Tax=Latimeria chalumnae TaxID=7897 RepID=H3AR59_LATCH
RLTDNGLVPFNFPKTKIALWDPSPAGEAISLHLAYYRNPRLHLVEKTARLAHRHAKQREGKSFSCFLLGSVVVDEDEEGVTLSIDRFDPGREVTGCRGKVPTALLPGDFVIPCMVECHGSSSSNIVVHTAEDFSTAFKMLQHYCCSKETMDPSKYLTVRARITCTENMDNLSFDFHWAAVTIATTFDVTPVKPVPIIPTALAKNLSSPLNIAQVQGSCRCGYLTMDQTRKLLLVLESDPKAYMLPLVGISINGNDSINTPPHTCQKKKKFSIKQYVKVALLLQPLVLSVSVSSVKYFLNFRRLWYTLDASNPQPQHPILPALRTLKIVPQNVESSGKQPVQFELSAESQNSEVDFFNEVVRDASTKSPPPSSPPNRQAVSDHDSGVEDEEFSPRPTPSPHPVSQQTPRIRPSVPELSIVFDTSFIDSKIVPRYPPMMANQLKNAGPQGPPLSPTQCLDRGFHNFGTQGSSAPLRSSLSPVNHSVPSMKPCRDRQQQAVPWQGGPPVPKVPAEKLRPKHNPPMHRKGALPVGSSPMTNPKHCCRPSSPGKGNIQTQQHNASFPPHTPKQPSELQMPVPHAVVQYPANICKCCPHHGHVSYCPNSWQEKGTVDLPKSPRCCSSEVHLGILHESTCSQCHQNVSCIASARCSTSSPINQWTYGKAESCSPPSASVILSPGRQHSSQTSPCKTQACAGHSTCTHFAIARSEETVGLPTDAYKILLEQDRQLKLLQAQIQQLLEAQKLQPCSKDSCSHHTSQPERQMEFVATETQMVPGLHMRKSVSIAVSTGASLFWNPPSDQDEELTSQMKCSNSEVSNEDIAMPVNSEEDTSHNTIASSLKAVDIHSFAESSQVTAEDSSQSSNRQNTPLQFRNEPVSQVPMPGESVSMCVQEGPIERANGHEVKTDDQGEATPTSFVPSAFKDDNQFYQDLLGQVNQLLKASPTENFETPQKGEVTRDYSPEFWNSNVVKKKHSNGDQNPKDSDPVLNATLKQLKNLGVKIDLDSSVKHKKYKNKIENASTLACINPEAIIPRLNYMSFANVGMSGFGPGGVDLSMEANAIALKYLNDSQLSQLSRSQSCGGNPVELSSFQNLLPTGSDKSMVGLSLISPSNMSFATKKYMKRYGLLECNESSEEEEEGDKGKGSEESQAESMRLQSLKPTVLEGLGAKRKASEKSLKMMSRNHCHHEKSGSASYPEPDLSILRNITNEIVSPRPQASAQPVDEDSLQILKDLKANSKLLAGATQFTQHPEKENGVGNVQVFPEKLKPSPAENLKQTASFDSVGNFLDVNRLRQLPKLF